MNSHFKVSEQMLGQASMGRNLPGMVSRVRPGPNAYDEGPASKPCVNTQPFNNERLAMQNAGENARTASSQAVANAMGQSRAAGAEQTDAQNKAQQLLNSRMSEALFANQSGNALLRIAAMQTPEKAKFESDILTGKLLASGMNPDLGAAAAQAGQYG